MNAVMKVNRMALVKLLEDRIETLTKLHEGDREVQEARESLRLMGAGETVDVYKTRLAAWHEAVAVGLEAGSISLTAKGALGAGSPLKPTLNKLIMRGQAYEEPEGLVKYFDSQLARKVDPLKSAVELLKLGYGDAVEINAADYNSLLGKR